MQENPLNPLARLGDGRTRMQESPLSPLDPHAFTSVHTAEYYVSSMS
jgi:hypothetical protein